MSAYDPKVTPWMVKAHEMPDHDLIRQFTYLLRYAILAPSCYNTQPWKFAVGAADGEAIDLHVDRARWLRVADADQRALFVSAGCALENLLVAAEHFAFAPRVAYFPDSADDTCVARVSLAPGGRTAPHRAHLFDSIPARHTNHRPYGAAPVPPEVLALLRGCVIEPGVSLFLTADAVHKREVDELVMKADARQFADPAYRAELAHWIGAGAFGTAWLAAKFDQLAVRLVNVSERHARHDAELLMSAPVLGVVATAGDALTQRVQAGQAFERAHLLATFLGLRLQPMNQVLQVPDLKQRLSEELPLGSAVPQMIFRLGYAEPEDEHTPRRPLEEMLISVPATAG